MSLEKRRTLIKAFVELQFNHCPLIWMLLSRTLNNKTNRIHEKALRIVYSDDKSSFNELLDTDSSFTIHQKNAQSLAIEIYKYLHGLSPTILGEGFKVNETLLYNLRMRDELYVRNPKTVRYGTKTISFLPPKIWALIPQNIKDSSFLPCFKKSIRKWKLNFPCRLCRTFLQHVGFIYIVLTQAGKAGKRAFFKNFAGKAEKSTVVAIKSWIFKNFEIETFFHLIVKSNPAICFVFFNSIYLFCF